jgi:large subunit ribosomal protein L35
MPKIKTRRGTAKRFKITGTGKVKRKCAYLRHQLSAKTRKQKRHLRQSAMVDATNVSAIKRLIPYL